jgi:hypothetical protein
MDLMDRRFLAVPEVAGCDRHAWRRQRLPTVSRGLASPWPAVRNWTFATLASLVDDVPVDLVAGERESGATRFVRSTLRRYLASLQAGAAPVVAPAPYLKEFDLLKAVPQLRGGLRYGELLPKRTMHALRTWIGPAGVGTGLHHDYLDNLAVQIAGIKRWRLVRAGAVERLGAVSDKYDPWAVLSSSSAGELAATGAPEDFFMVDLHPGDVLHVPAGWWHEIVNLTPCIMVGGFFGRPVDVLSRYAWVSSRNLKHRMGWLAHGHCTCHAAGCS